jgi:hypothetical protein
MALRSIQRNMDEAVRATMAVFLALMAKRCPPPTQEQTDDR